MTNKISKYISDEIRKGRDLPLIWSFIFLTISLSIAIYAWNHFSTDAEWTVPPRERSSSLYGKFMERNPIIKRNEPIKILSNGRVYYFSCLPGSTQVGCWGIDRNKISGKNVNILYFVRNNDKNNRLSNIILEISEKNNIIKSYESRLGELAISKMADISSKRNDWLWRAMGFLVAIYLSWSIIIGKLSYLFVRR